MVFVQDEGSTFDAPIDVVWKYIMGGEGHDARHVTTRNPTFEGNGDPTLLYSAERLFEGRWSREHLRISMFPPVSTVTEILDGPLVGSKMVYVYRPVGPKTRIDVFGEFTSKTIPEADLAKVVLERLAGEFEEDAPGVRAFAKRP